MLGMKVSPIKSYVDGKKVLGIESIALRQKLIAIFQIRTHHVFDVTKKGNMKEALATFWPTNAILMRPVGLSS